MSRSSFSKAYEEIGRIESMEMTFTIEDADLDKLNEVLKDINVKECPWFEVQDKYGNKARYYREPHWIPCSERLPEIKEYHESDTVLCFTDMGAYAFSKLQENIFGQCGFECEREDEYYTSVGKVIA